MKKIAFITESVYPYFFGGQEKMIYDYATMLSQHNAVKVVTMKQWDGASTMIKDGVTYAGICPRLAIYKKNGKRNTLSSLWLGIKTFFWVLRSREDILLINVFPYFPLLFARLALFFKTKKPIIIGSWAEYWGKGYWQKYYPYHWWMGVFLERMSYGACDHILAISHFTKEKIAHAFPDGKKDIAILPPAYIDAEAINSVPAQEKKYDMIYYGRIIAHKRVEHIVHIVEQFVSQHISVRALIIGNGPDKERISDMIKTKKLEDHIDLEDFVEDYATLITRIKSSKVMIQPSEREGFGITVAEANTCGLPVFVIAYPDNASAELVKNGVNGYVCADEDDLYQKVRDVLCSADSQEQLTALSGGAVKEAEQYTLQVMQKKITTFFTQEKFIT
ncbi:MAG: glycosyltransferase family 4 protein [Parcubacteria group bacterium]|jgi:glycosyltransferase involved in cell wall biosynthesis